MKKKVAVVARGLTKGGVRRYIFNILEQFENYKPDYQFYVFYNQKELFEDKFDYAEKIYIKGNNKLIWDYIKFPVIASKYNLDTILYPKNIIPFTHLLLPSKKINVVHDLGYFEKKLNAYKTFDTLYMKTFMKISCKISDKTIAVSAYTKKDIVNRLNIGPQRVEAIPEAVEDKFKVIENKDKLQKVIKKYELKLPFIFYCGSLSPRKNLVRTLKAFNKIKHKIPHSFYLTGNKKWSEGKTLEFVKENLKDRVKILGYVSEDELVALYNLADLFVFPSLYEGFGLPILEAQACGTPVLTSNVTSCPEVAGDSAHLVDPYLIKEIKSGMLKIVKDRAYNKELIEKGLKNVKRFSWKKTAARIIEEAKKC